MTDVLLGSLLAHIGAGIYDYMDTPKKVEGARDIVALYQVMWHLAPQKMLLLSGAGYMAFTYGGNSLLLGIAAGYLGRMLIGMGEQ